MMDNLDPSTTVRKYSLVVQAGDAEQTALDKWNEAYRRYTENDSPANRAALIAASNEFQKVKKEADRARTIYKHNHFVERKSR